MKINEAVNHIGELVEVGDEEVAGNKTARPVREPLVQVREPDPFIRHLALSTKRLWGAMSAPHPKPMEEVVLFLFPAG